MTPLTVFVRTLMKSSAICLGIAFAVTHPGLDATQKREILENWRVDAARLAESAGENMAGGEEPMLQRVNNALLELERQTGVEGAHKRGIT